MFVYAVRVCTHTPIYMVTVAKSCIYMCTLRIHTKVQLSEHKQIRLHIHTDIRVYIRTDRRMHTYACMQTQRYLCIYLHTQLQVCIT